MKFMQSEWRCNVTRQNQGTALFTAILALVGVDLVVQLWLLSASVDAVSAFSASPPDGRADRGYRQLCAGPRRQERGPGPTWL